MAVPRRPVQPWSFTRDGVFSARCTRSDDSNHVPIILIRNAFFGRAVLDCLGHWRFAMRGIRGNFLSTIFGMFRSLIYWMDEGGLVVGGRLDGGAAAGRFRSVLSVAGTGNRH
jgi:hypothetical protein